MARRKRRSSRRRSSRRRSTRRNKRRGRRARTVFYVIPDPQGGWRVQRGKRRYAWADLKRDAVKVAREAALEVFARGRKSQIVVYKKNGRIQYEHTYRADPRQYVG